MQCTDCKNIFKGDKKIEVIKSSLFENLSEELIFELESNIRIFLF